MISIKCKIQNKIDISDYLRQYNCVLRFAYNRFKDDSSLSLSQCENAVKSTMKNINLIDSSLIKCAVGKAKAIPNDGIIFGTKRDFLKLKYKKKFSKEAWISKRNNRPILLRGSSSDLNGNRKALLNIIDENSITLKLNIKTHIDIQLPRLSKNQKVLLHKLQTKCEVGEANFSLEVNNDYVCIIFDELSVKEQLKDITKPQRKNRILSFDMNPNSIGLTVSDWLSEYNQKIIHKEIIDLKQLNDTQSNKKIKYELLETSKYISKLAIHYGCDLVAFERLNIKSKDAGKGKKFNKLVNNVWIRNAFVNNLKKRCNLNNIKYLEITPHYSSFVGQLTNPAEYDSIGASIELSRRGFLVKNNTTGKLIPFESLVYPTYGLVHLTTHWKEMLDGISNEADADSWKKLYDMIKKSKTSYRRLFIRDKSVSEFSSRFSSVKSKVFLYNFTCVN